MPIRQIQSTFTLGELDPKLYARADFEGYFKGARKLRNVNVIPQGGAIRRFGTKNIARVRDTTSNLDITDFNEINGILYEFSVSENKNFLIIAHPEDQLGTPAVRFDVYLNGVLQTFQDTTDYTAAQIKDLFFLPSQDRVLIFHPDVQPKQLLRVTDNNWQLGVLNFVIYPAFDYSFIDNTSYRGPTDSYTPSAVSGIGITVTSVNAVFHAGHVGGLFVGNGGVMRITAVNGAGTVATGDTIIPFDSTAAIKGADAIIQERAWGDFTGGVPPAPAARGWPAKATFFQNRLIVAKTDTLRNTNWFSAPGDFLNFDDSEPNFINGFSLSIGSEQRESVQHLVGTKGLVVLGTQGIYGTSLFVDSPLSATNAFLNEQARDGADAVQAQVLDNQVMFVDDSQQLVKTIIYDINSSSFNVLDATLLSSHLVDVPIASGVYRPTNNVGDLYMLCNKDGSLLTFQSLRAQNVAAWSLSETDGNFRDIYAKGRDCFFLVERYILDASASFLPNAIFKVNSTFEAFTDIFDAVSSGVTNVSLFDEANDYILVGHTAPFTTINFQLAAFSTQDLVFTTEYLDNFGNWVPLTSIDNTNGFQNSGTITWTQADSQTWFKQDINKVLIGGSQIVSRETVNGTNQYWVRIRRNNTNTLTAPIEQTVAINSKKIQVIEQADYSVYTDCTYTATTDALGVISNLNDLSGQFVYITNNTGVPSGPFYVTQAGTIQTNFANLDVIVGLNYTPLVIPMPLVAQFAFSQTVYQPKHIKSIYIDYVDSLGITVNGYEIPSLSLNNFILDQAIRPVSSFTEYTPMRGWDPRAENTISQELPLPMTLIGIGYIAEIS